jgi:hypothetical protein
VNATDGLEGGRNHKTCYQDQETDTDRLETLEPAHA